MLDELGERAAAAIERNHLVGVTFVNGDLERARSIQEENLVVCRELGLDEGVNRSYYNLGLLGLAQENSTKQ